MSLRGMLILLRLLELIDTCWDVNNIARPAGSATSSELIDTCWDVNLFSSAFCMLFKLELIDTCWDVNPCKPLCQAAFLFELIDTCWDVNNSFSSLSSSAAVRINRYMLGCKYVIIKYMKVHG